MKKIALLSAIVLPLLIGVRAQADVLDVLNGDFETDTVTTYTVPDTISDWTSPFSGGPYNNVGLAPSTYHAFTGDTSGNVAVLASYIPSSFGGFPATIIQSGIANTDSDTAFTFTVAVAEDSSHPYSTFSPPTFTLTLSDQNGKIAQQSFSTSTLLKNDFQDYSITGYAGDATSLSISIQASGSGSLLLDNASLTGGAVPEPANWGWIPFLGTISFLAFRRFRGTAKA